MASRGRSWYSSGVSMCVETMDTPLGELYLAAREDALCAVAFADHWPAEQALLARRGELRQGGVPRALRDALEAYFAGELRAIDNVPVDAEGTPFQKRVWAALRTVPAGATASYAAISAAIGDRSAVRAVGLANGKNPVAIVVPCHRIIGSDGALRGYAGGLERKRWLLEHEGALAPLFARR